MSIPLLSLQGLTKAYPGVVANDGVSLDIGEGEVHALLGENGAGKSTLIKIMTGIYQPDEGEIAVGDQTVSLPTAHAAFAHGITAIHQETVLFDELSVAENIVFGLRVRRVSRGERDARLKRVAELVGLGQLLDRKPSQLSGGQRQRVALGRAIIAEAKVCLMDEPLSNLDAKLRHEMRTEIRALQQRLGMTMVYVTHDQTEAMTMADRVVLMRDGRVEQNGTPEQLYNRPATAFTARFIGTPPMNLIAEGECQVGIRPEDIRVVSHDGRIARVNAVEHLGADSIVLCEIAGQPVAVRQSGFSKVAPGDTILLAWDDVRAHQFDRASGRRLEAAGENAASAVPG